MSIRISAYNRGPDPADLHIIPQMFFKNYWFWPKEEPAKPEMKQVDDYVIQTDHKDLGRSYLYCSTSPAPSAPPRRRGEAPEPINDEEVIPTLLFTENETNFERLYNGQNKNTYAKDAFHDHIVPAHRMEKDRPQPVRKTRKVKKTITKLVKKFKAASLKTNGDSAKTNGVNGHASSNGTDDGESTAGEDDDEEEIREEIEEDEEYYELPEDTTPSRDYVNPEKKGTKAGAHYVFEQVPGNGGCAVVRMKLTPKTPKEDPSINDDEQFDAVVEKRIHEADEFYTRIASGPISDEMKAIMRQALAGMLW